jgi:flagellar protein FliJ
VVLRVREVRERMARGGVARAQVEELDAQERLDATAELLANKPNPSAVDPQAFIAAFTARQSMAAQVRALQQLHEVRRLATVHATAAWRRTEQDRAGVDKLAVRHHEALVAQDLSAEQLELDDVASRRRDDEGGAR